MRIVAGRWRGRRFEAPAGDLVRPTGDRVREAWLSIVHHELPDARVLDLCAGAGALGLEALSRGAATCDFVDNAPRAVAVIEKNLAALGGHAGAHVVRSDALRFLAPVPARSYDVAFADPPYASDLGGRLVERWLAAPFAAIFGVEHASEDTYPAPGRSRRYGSTTITFYHIDDA